MRRNRPQLTFEVQLCRRGCRRLVELRYDPANPPKHPWFGVCEACQTPDEKAEQLAYFNPLRPNVTARAKDRVEKIISGGQSGADLAGLVVGRRLGIPLTKRMVSFIWTGSFEAGESQVLLYLALCSLGDRLR